MSRFVVGIDLGTTNSAMAYADLGELPAPIVKHLPIPQVAHANEVSERPVLPSFLYLAGEKEFTPTALDLPWAKKADRAVGLFAREQGSKVPGRLVASAKSWLCHSGVDRRGAILPWAALDGVGKVSPVQASSAYLNHLRLAWNHKIAGSDDKAKLEHQEIMLTVPASFDPAARELTLEAAKLAGLNQVTLLEEPQAAFYAWLEKQGKVWRKLVKVGQTILVCDVGGGTSDFSLISVVDQGGELGLSRVAVGEHILLGGDNMDLALAHAVAAGIPGGMEKLDPIQRLGLTYSCRAAKEALFQFDNLKVSPVTILGRGSKVIGGTIKTELTRALLEQTLVEGFFPVCDPAEAPGRSRRVGLSEVGLPYASEPAITRHLARFLTRQAGSLHSDSALFKPSAVLFNGGVFEAPPLRQRLLDVLGSWTGTTVPALDAPHLDLAVARGAAYYGLARRGQGIRIRGGVSRSFYIGIETSAPAVPGLPPPLKALCVVPMGMEEGTKHDVPSPPLNLWIGEPAHFHFLSSTTRRDDKQGLLLDRWDAEELQMLEPLETTLPIEDDGSGTSGASSDAVPVKLEASVTEVGVLELWCQASERPGRRWKLEFDVRDS